MTVALDRLSALSAEKRLLLQLLAKEKRGHDAGLVPLQPSLERPARLEPFAMIETQQRPLLPAEIEDAYPLTTVQLGMLYHMELATDDGVPSYHNVNSFHLKVPYHREAFERALQTVVGRHPILRTSFDLTTFREPIQLVHRTARMPLAETDLRNLGFQEQRTLLRRFFDDENRRLLPLDKPPLMRFHVHRRTDETLQLTITEPHAISDGWSTTSTLAEIFSIYLAYVRREPAPPMAESATSFRDYVYMEREALRSTESKQFWERKLEGATILGLPIWSSERTPARKGYHRKPTAVVPADVTSGLERLARDAQVPLKTVLLAVHMKALSIAEGTRDVLSGLITHGRPEVLGGEQVRGLFVNTVPFRLHLEPGSWLKLIKAVFAAEVELMPHRRYPLMALQSADRPLLDIAFTYLHFHSVEQIIRSGGVTFLESGHSDRSVDHYSLSATFVYDRSESPLLSLTLEHKSEFSPPQVQSLLDLYLEIAGAMVAAPEAPHHGRSYLPAAQRHALDFEWSRGTAAARPAAALHDLVSARAARAPGAVALIGETSELSAGDLDRRANRLARRLLRAGVLPGDRVALCLERGIEMVVAMLAILKVGGAYVPLDPEYPAERLAFLARDSRPAALVATSALKERALIEGAKILLDLEAEAIAAESDELPLITVDPDQLAYVIYTSGSTGRPKGVMVSHRAILNRLLWMNEELPLAPSDRVLHKTPFSFDASIWEIFAPLLAGAGVVLARSGGHRDASYMTAVVRERSVTVLQLVPSLLRAVIDDPGFTACRDLRRLFCGGEALESGVAERAHELLPGLEIINLYGPTEAAIDSASYRYRARPGGATVPIGRPLANLRLHVVLDDGGPAPLGTPGELLIGGVNLARGYHDRPDLTAERFVPDSFSGAVGERLYRSGDLVRWLPSGEIEFLGRIDQQIKIRGLRVEPGEIEATLGSHPQVWQCAVVASERNREIELVAYVVANEDPPQVAELRRFLTDRLPRHMVPATFLLLGELPRTPSGKLDRQALPAPGVGPTVTEAAFVAARSPIEEVLTSIWADVLGVDRVGVHSGFFELGGHSLSVTRVVSRVRKVFGIELKMARLFENPTVAGLAKVVEAALRRAEISHLPPLIVVDHDVPLPLSFAQQRLWFLHRLDPESASYNIPMHLRLRGRLDLLGVARAISEVVRRHESLRTTFTEIDEQPLQRVQPASAVPLPRIDLSGLATSCREGDLGRISRAEARRSFDLNSGPLLRSAVSLLGPRDQALLFTLHHIVGDGWSTGILVGEVASLYEDFTRGVKPSLPDLPIQYPDFAVWQRGWLRDEALAAQLTYWRGRLAGARSTELPADGLRPEGRAQKAGYFDWSLSAELLLPLVELSRHQEATLFMTLVAAYAVVLAHAAETRDIVLGTDIANRNHVGTERLIGFFVNQLVLRFDLSGSPPFTEVLGRVREATLGAYAHQDLPFERLVEEIRPDRDAALSRLFQSKLILQNAPSTHLKLPDLEISGFEFESGAAKFEFLLNLAVGDAGLVGGLEYSADLFSEETARLVLARFHRVLERAATDPTVTVDDLIATLTAEEEERVGAERRLEVEVKALRLRTARRRSSGEG